MANIIKRVWNQNRMVQIEDLKGMTFQAEQAGHTFQISGIDDDGNTVVLTGTPSGVLLRPDNTDVALTCSVSGGVVSATLPANCYDVPGRFGLTIFITSGSSKTAIYAAVGTVTRTSSGTVAPGTSQSVVDLINAINAAVNSIPASYSALLADIAPTYSDSALYSVGQYAWYDGDLKRCIVPITTAESYTAAHWTSAVLGQDVSDLKSALFLSTGNKQIDMTDGAYYDLSGSSVTIGAPTPYTSKKYALVPCVAGDVFTVSGNGGSGARCWAFVNSSGSILLKAATGTLANEVVFAPKDSAYLILNNDKSNTSVSYYGQYVEKTVEKNRKEILGFFSGAMKQITGNQIVDFTNNAYVNLASSTITMEDGVPKIVPATGSYTGFKCAVIPCSEGDVFTVNATSRKENARVHGFIKADGTALSRANELASDVQRVLIAPENTAYLVINTQDDQSSYYGKAFKDSVDETLESLDSLSVKWRKILTSSDDVNTITIPGVYDVTNTGDDTWMPANWPLTGGGNLVVTGSGTNSRVRKTQMIYTHMGYMLFRVGIGSTAWSDWFKLTDTTGEVKAQNVGIGAEGLIASLAERVAILEQANNIDTIPSYYESMIESKSSAINGLVPTKGKQFVFITDTHVTGYANRGGNAMHSHSLINYLCRNTLVDMVVNGGDILSGTSDSSGYYIPSIGSIDNIRKGIRYSQPDSLTMHFYVGGNHDLGASNSQAANISSKMLAKQANLHSPSPYGVVYDEVTPFQYYLDDETNKVRIIVLCMGMSGSSGLSGHTWWDDDAVLFANAVPFYLSALKSTPSNYHIVVINHMSGIPTSNETGGFEAITSANYINYLHKPFVAYQQKTTWSYNDISEDFSSVNGIAACMIFGHMHRDITGISSDIVSSGSSIGGTIPLFATTTDNAGGNLDENVTREIGTESEQAFDVFTIDTTNRKIFVTRIGGGNDRTNNGNGYSY